jgi:membrane-associated phospholipid phosphatase
VLIATATVYGRYHYAADAFAGLAAALIAVFVARLVEQRSGLGL